MKDREKLEQKLKKLEEMEAVIKEVNRLIKINDQEGLRKIIPEIQKLLLTNYRFNAIVDNKGEVK